MGDEDKKDDGKSLLLFQLGPVQSFISQAETVGDLKAGSELLSELTAAAVRTVPGWEDQGEDAALVFPAVKGEADLKGIPNRFLAFVTHGRGEEIAQKAAAAAQKRLGDIAGEVWPKLELPEEKHDAFNRQVAAFLQTTWAVLEDPTGDMGNDYATIGKLMAMRRNVRAFEAWGEESDGEVKDFLSGREAALDVAGRHAANRNCGRGALNLIKRVRGDQNLPQTDKTLDQRMEEVLGKYPYIAVIAMDGDHMGAKLSGFTTQDGHRRFSEQLAAFAREVKIEADEGVLIYAGGDDVLAVVRATRAVAVARRVAEQFVAALNDPGRREITASVGIAIGSTKVPLQDLVHAAHEAESRAKHVYGRDALALDIYKRSGEILKWGCKFGSRAFDVYRRLSDYAQLNPKDAATARFAYKLAGFLDLYGLDRRVKTGEDPNGRSILKSVFEGDDGGTLRDVVAAETQHVIEQTQEAKKMVDIAELKAYLAEIGEGSVERHPEDYLGLFLVETFIDRPRTDD